MKSNNPEREHEVKTLTMDLGSLHDNLDKAIPFFIHCVYERTFNDKTTEPFNLTTANCREITALMKDKFNLPDAKLFPFLETMVVGYNSDFTVMGMSAGAGRIEDNQFIFDTFNASYSISDIDLLPEVREHGVIVYWDVHEDNISVSIPLKN